MADRPDLTAVYSVNVPVPWEVRRLAASLEPAVTGFASVRDRYTLVVKRLDGRDLDDLHRIRERLRPALAGVAPFGVRVTGIDAFERPPLGEGPVVYLAVEAVDDDAGGVRGRDPLRAVHDRLVREFGGVDGLEGADYVPHVTLARGWAGHGDPGDAVARLRERGVEGVRWTVDELGVWTREYEEIAARVPLRG
ncbi:2'-5' RNA ligase family protein [Halobaculum litoreum]|uniref:2'-5' RNA ligase family protein n=1 Tax=Halobaculum litoreum TaxID=3031998 RepID=A0ABD5XU95_9EURY